jgi:rhodanese-related sulfurtransferase
MKLRAGGLGEVYVLAGGVAAWREAGLPIRK